MKLICVRTEEDAKRYNLPIRTWLVLSDLGKILYSGSYRECKEYIYREHIRKLKSRENMPNDINDQAPHEDMPDEDIPDNDTTYGGWER